MSGLIDYSWKGKLRKPIFYFKTVHHFDDLALKSPITTVETDSFEQVIPSSDLICLKIFEIHRQTDLVIYKVTQ